MPDPRAYDVVADREIQGTDWFPWALVVATSPEEAEALARGRWDIVGPVGVRAVEPIRGEPLTGPIGLVTSFEDLWRYGSAVDDPEGAQCVACLIYDWAGHAESCFTCSRCEACGCQCEVADGR